MDQSVTNHNVISKPPTAKKKTAFYHLIISSFAADVLRGVGVSW
jgi:hypothetical protein